MRIHTYLYIFMLGGIPYGYMYIYIYTYIHIYLHISKHTNIYAQILLIHIYIYVCIRMGSPQVKLCGVQADSGRFRVVPAMQRQLAFGL